MCYNPDNCRGINIPGQCLPAPALFNTIQHPKGKEVSRSDDDAMSPTVNPDPDTGSVVVSMTDLADPSVPVTGLAVQSAD